VITNSVKLPCSVVTLIRPPAIVTKKRQFASLKELADEQCNVRVWGGIHFRNSLDVGVDMGKTIADYMVEHSLKLSH
jgi:hypothetical protein